VIKKKNYESVLLQYNNEYQLLGYFQGIRTYSVPEIRRIQEEVSELGKTTFLLINLA
jgi:hypothetical protein